jgi:hypothetical protein
MNNRIKMTDSKFKCNIFLFLSVTVFMARLSITHIGLYDVVYIVTYRETTTVDFLAILVLQLV